MEHERQRGEAVPAITGANRENLKRAVEYLMDVDARLEKLDEDVSGMKNKLDEDVDILRKQHREAFEIVKDLSERLQTVESEVRFSEEEAQSRPLIT